MTIHELKILPPFFEAVKSGKKTFETRDNSDRGFQAGDTVVLREWVRGAIQGAYTGAELTFKIGYVSDYYQRSGYVVFSLLPVDEIRA